MPKFAANLSMLFTEAPFLQRFALARAAGFTRVEFQFPYTFLAEEVARASIEAGTQVVLFNLPAGRFEMGERGLASLPDRDYDFDAGVDLAIRYARALRCPTLNCLCGLRDTRFSLEAQLQALTRNAKRAADHLAAQGIRMVMEFLNPIDAPGYLLPHPRQMFDFVRELNHPNIRVQYDFYHVQSQQVPLIETLLVNIDLIGHVQFADAPGRHEPGTGEIDFDAVFCALDECGYTGFVGAEYAPMAGTRASLKWHEAWREKSK